MIDQELLILQAVRKALDDSGIAPGADEDDAKELIEKLFEQGYEVTKTAPEVPDEEAGDEV